MSLTLSSLQFQNPNPIPTPIQFSRHPRFKKTLIPKPPNSHENSDEGIPISDVKTISQFKSRHNHIRVLEISRKAEHPLAGSRLLLLDAPGNIHSISFLFKTLTHTYFDVFATLPPLLPPGPVSILGFGAGSAARIILEFYPEVVIHGWEIDPSVISVARELFGLRKLEKKYPDRLFIYVGNGLNASLESGFSGILVDVFDKGSLVPELQDPNTWEEIRKRLRKGGRVMVNVGGRCVEPEDKRRDARVVMEETLKAMEAVFGDEGLWVLRLGGDGREEDSSIALTGGFPDLGKWRNGLPRPLRGYVDMWLPFVCQFSPEGSVIPQLHRDSFKSLPKNVNQDSFMADI